MASVKVVNMNNKKVKDVELPEKLASLEKAHLIHTAVVNQLANKRAGTAATKTRDLVRGGGKKPWRQKGTGRARAGSNRSPLWRGGGVVFGPLPRDYSYTVPKKMKKAALAAAFAAKVNDKKLVLLDQLSLNEPKTKMMTELLKKLGVEESALVLIASENRNVALAARNIPSVKVLRLQNINIYDLMKYRYLVTTQEALSAIEEAYGK